MLKTTKETVDSKLIRISLHGYFTAEYVPEVKKSLFEWSQRQRSRIDLTNVTFIDRTAMEFVREAMMTRLLPDSSNVSGPFYYK
jgi:anti-anti-sigma regulatory factor